MAPTKHSTFSASASHRLLSCPGSYALGQLHDKGRKSSIYSAEGTLAHAMSEAAIFSGQAPISFLGQTRTVEQFEFTVDEEFVDAVQVYVDFIQGLRAMGYIVALEQEVSPQVQWEGLKPLPIDLFGTCDCIAYNPDLRVLLIVDLKFGKGIPVEVANNPQTLYYASGAMDKNLLDVLVASAGATNNGVEEVRTVIVQPRAFHVDGPIRQHVYTPAEVRDWARLTLYSGVRRALNDNGKTLCAGKWCRFCPALPHCSAPKDLLFDTARAAFLGAPLQNIPLPDDPGAALPGHEITDDMLGELLDQIDVLKPWFDALVALAQERSLAGHKIKGWKLVPKRALRRWADGAEEMLRTLDQSGLDPDLYSERTLLTPAQVERRAGKQVYQDHIAQHVVKNSSGTTLAPDGDPRARIRAGRTAQEAFAIPAQQKD